MVVDGSGAGAAFNQDPDGLHKSGPDETVQRRGAVVTVVRPCAVAEKGGDEPRIVLAAPIASTADPDPVPGFLAADSDTR